MLTRELIVFVAAFVNIGYGGLLDDIIRVNRVSNSSSPLITIGVKDTSKTELPIAGDEDGEIKSTDGSLLESLGQHIEEVVQTAFSAVPKVPHLEDINISISPSTHARDGISQSTHTQERTWQSGHTHDEASQSSQTDRGTSQASRTQDGNSQSSHTKDLLQTNPVVVSQRATESTLLLDGQNSETLQSSSSSQEVQGDGSGNEQSVFLSTPIKDVTGALQAGRMSIAETSMSESELEDSHEEGSESAAPSSPSSGEDGSSEKLSSLLSLHHDDGETERLKLSTISSQDSTNSPLDVGMLKPDSAASKSTPLLGADGKNHNELPSSSSSPRATNVETSIASLLSLLSLPSSSASSGKQDILSIFHPPDLRPSHNAEDSEARQHSISAGNPMMIQVADLPPLLALLQHRKNTKNYQDGTVGENDGSSILPILSSLLTQSTTSSRGGHSQDFKNLPPVILVPVMFPVETDGSIHECSHGHHNRTPENADGLAMDKSKVISEETVGDDPAHSTAIISNTSTSRPTTEGSA